MYYDDYFDSFSITSTSKAPEYPLSLKDHSVRFFQMLNPEVSCSHLSPVDLHRKDKQFI